MSNFKNFNELWEACESLNKDLGDSHISQICNQIKLQIDLYQNLENPNLSDQEKETIKSRIMGEILFLFTNLSLKDNINVFKALNTVYLLNLSDLT